MKTAQALHFAFPVFPFPAGLGITGPGGEPAELERKGICVCVCVSVSCPECFPGPDRAFWPAEERMPLTVGGGCPDDRPEDQMLLVSWVEGRPEGGVPSPEELS